MRPLGIDFHRKPRPSVLGWTLLAYALAALAVLVALQRQFAQEATTYQAARQDIELLLPGAGRPEDTLRSNDPDLAAAQEVLMRADIPWNALLEALEAADGPDMALLAVTPDAARGHVQLHAEARHLAAMLEYQQRLQADNRLREVTLRDHELIPGNSGTPVRFHLTARWGVKHGTP